MVDLGSTDAAVVTSRDFNTGPARDYLINLEDSIKHMTNVEFIHQDSYSYKLYRLVDLLRGKQNSNAVPWKLTQLINYIGRIMNIGDDAIKLPTKQYFESKRYETLIFILGQVYETRVLDTVDWKKKNIILYVGDPWEPKLEDLSEYINYYDIDVVFLPFLQSVNILDNTHENIYWLPQAVRSTIWTDYDLEKKYKYIQFGRRDPRLHEFALEDANEQEYIYQFIESNSELAKTINQSKYCLVSPRRLQYPEQTGNISPVTLRYFQAIACKSLPAGFKPDEFDDVFVNDINFAEYTNQRSFRKQLDRYNNNPMLYRRAINENYRILNKHHTWRERAKAFIRISSNLSS